MKRAKFHGLKKRKSELNTALLSGSPSTSDKHKPSDHKRAVAKVEFIQVFTWNVVCTFSSSWEDFDRLRFLLFSTV